MEALTLSQPTERLAVVQAPSACPQARLGPVRHESDDHARSMYVALALRMCFLSQGRFRSRWAQTRVLWCDLAAAGARYGMLRHVTPR